MPVSSSFELNQEQQDQLNDLVWTVIQHAVKQQKFVYPDAPDSAKLLAPGASFITLYANDELRGCTGICEAENPLWQDVCDHAYSSLNDRRFLPIQEQELAHLSFHISVLSPIHPMTNMGELSLIEQLIPGKDGLIMEQNYRHAVFLPSVWRNINSPKAFVRALKHKGGWESDYWHPSIKLFRFTTFEFAHNPNQ